MCGQQLFDPIGIYDVGWKPVPNTGSRFYPHDTNTPLDQINGTAYGNWDYKEGSAGIHLSVHEISEFLLRMWTPGSYLSKDMLDAIKQYNMCGGMIDSPIDGLAFTKGGYFPGSWNGGSQLSSCIIRFAKWSPGHALNQWRIECAKHFGGCLQCFLV